MQVFSCGMKKIKKNLHLFHFFFRFETQNSYTKTKTICQVF